MTDYTYTFLSPNEKHQYIDDVTTLVEDNYSDFTPWDEYVHEDGSIDLDFFENYERPDAHLLVVEDVDEDVVAFSVLEREETRSDYPIIKPFTVISLSLVDETHRGNGIGTEMAEQLLEIERQNNTPRVAIATWDHNTTQLEIYRELGFELVGVKLNHRYDGSDSLYLGISLDDSELEDYSTPGIISDVKLTEYI